MEREPTLPGHDDAESMDVTASRRLEWDSAHRVLRHESKCRTLHGHRYTAEVVVSARALDDVGRVVDFGVIKSKVGAWIDEQWDHTTLVNVDDDSLFDWCMRDAEANGNKMPFPFTGEPTAENIAKVLLRVAHRLLAPHGVRVDRVRVWETPNCSATARNVTVRTQPA